MLGEESVDKMLHLALILAFSGIFYLIFGIFKSAFEQVLSGDEKSFGILAKIIKRNRPLYLVICLGVITLAAAAIYIIAS